MICLYRRSERITHRHSRPACTPASGYIFAWYCPSVSPPQILLARLPKKKRWLATLENCCFPLVFLAFRPSIRSRLQGCQGYIQDRKCRKWIAVLISHKQSFVFEALRVQGRKAATPQSGYDFGQNKKSGGCPATSYEVTGHPPLLYCYGICDRLSQKLRILRSQPSFPFIFARKPDIKNGIKSAKPLCFQGFSDLSLL